MAEDNADERRPVGRRVLRRGRSPGFSGSGVRDSSSGARVGGDDHEQEAEILEAPATLPSLGETAPQPQGRHLAGQPAEDFNPAARMAQVRARASPYEREYRLGLMHRLMMRKIPMDQIADQLGISMATAYRDRDELKKQLRADARSLDIEEIIGGAKGFYEEASAMAMRAASNSDAPLPIRLAAIRTGLAAENDKHRMLQTTGVYDVLRYRASHEGGNVSDVRRLMDQTERVLAGDDLEFSNAAADVADSGSIEDIIL